MLFCDLVGSTQLAERFDAEDLRELVRAYQAAAAGAIERYEGHIAQYLGDGLLVYFGYPRAHEDAPRRAVLTGLEIVASMARLNAELERTYGVALSVRVAIHSDYAVAGDVGGQGRTEQLAIGKTPNIAARLQDLAKPNTVVVSDAVERMVKRWFVLESRGEHALKGISAPMGVWQVLRVNAMLTPLESAGRGLSPLVGREREIETLVGIFEKSRAGATQIALIAAEPGLGKTRLLHGFDTLCPGRPTFIYGGCSPYDGNTALAALVPAIHRLFGLDPSAPALERAEGLAAWVATSGLDNPDALALLSGLLGLPCAARPTLAVSPQKQREHALALLVEIAVRAARVTPLVLVIEDAHWSDPSTLAFIDLLRAGMSGAPILTVVTFRPTFTPPWTAGEGVTRIELTRVADDDARRIIRTLAGGRALPPDIERRLLERGDGVPLYLEEMTKALMESGVLSLRDDAWTLTRPMEAETIPATLRDSLMARLDRFVSVKEIAQAASAIGRDFTFELLAAVAPVPEPTLRAHVTELLSAEIILPVGEPGSGEYRFKHALIQDTAYDSMLKSRRREVHEHIATTLEAFVAQGSDVAPATVARHWEGAGRGESAAPWLNRAAQRGMERGAHTEAMATLAHALEVLAALPASSARDRVELETRVSTGASSRRRATVRPRWRRTASLRASSPCVWAGRRRPARCSTRSG